MIFEVVGVMDSVVMMVMMIMTIMTTLDERVVVEGVLNSVFVILYHC